MPIPSAFVIRFFQLVTKRQFTEAERELQRLKEKIQKTEWNKGYYKALYGMLLARKANNDQYVFLSKLDLKNKEELKKYRREFLEHVKNRLHTDYDRGFFSAWADLIRVALKTQRQSLASKQTSPPVPMKKPVLVEKKKEKSSTHVQASIKQFLSAKAEPR